jgi:putative IMPACT (imprinted ancient) family translation regulator
MSGTHQLLAYADDVNLLGDNIDTMEKNTETLIDASKEYMLISCCQNVDQNWNIKIVNKSFENLSQFKYLQTTVTKKNLIQEEIKRRLS